MDLTLAICTWNRASVLDQTLRALATVQAPRDDWELLVVDNNSTDTTPAVVHRYSDQLPLRYLFEPQAGKANAANLAVDRARGRLIVWTDDDVLPDPGWLVSYCQAAKRWPECAVFGGPILPHFEGTPPRWLRDVIHCIPTAYGVRDFGDDPLLLTPERVPYGANFAVRADVQRQFRFDPTLGVNGRKRVGGYETSVIRQMLAAGHFGRWVPGARLRHFVRKEIQTARFLRHYYHAQGWAAAHGQTAQQRCPTLFRQPRWLWRQAIQAELRYRWRRVFCKPEVWIRDLVESSCLWGELAGNRPSRPD